MAWLHPNPIVSQINISETGSVCRANLVGGSNTSEKRGNLDYISLSARNKNKICLKASTRNTHSCWSKLLISSLGPQT
jgi:hypothetical protein